MVCLRYVVWLGLDTCVFKGREDTGFGKKFEIRFDPDKIAVQLFGYTRILLFTF